MNLDDQIKDGKTERQKDRKTERQNDKEKKRKWQKERIIHRKTESPRCEAWLVKMSDIINVDLKIN